MFTEHLIIIPDPHEPYFRSLAPAPASALAPAPALVLVQLEAGCRDLTVLHYFYHNRYLEVPYSQEIVETALTGTDKEVEKEVKVVFEMSHYSCASWGENEWTGQCLNVAVTVTVSGFVTVTGLSRGSVGGICVEKEKKKKRKGEEKGMWKGLEMGMVELQLV